ncbi:MAG: PfkB family carbohydrate kinase [Planctomycetota bacterium]|jgi:fructokinase|nr:PfkB family carbohydrate kinase [Planctomycetota bacterium]
MTEQAAVLCIGEALWDCLPRGLFLGGAPLNVAYHLSQLGRQAAPVTAVGDDFLGQEIIRRAAGFGLDTTFISTVDRLTGVVQVRLENGQPSYDIVDQVAWDVIPTTPALLEAAQAAPALVYGSLASRHDNNRALVTAAIEACAGLTVFDVNLRAPFDDQDLVWDFAKRSQLVKLNDEEIANLVGAGELADQAERLRERCDCRYVCVTAGSRGAGLLSPDGWQFAAAEPITLADAVGAGDSFMAALLDGLLQQADPAAALHRAARLAEFVASSDGATPSHDQAPRAARKLS